MIRPVALYILGLLGQACAAGFIFCVYYAIRERKARR